MAKKPLCFRKQNSILLPWLNSLGLDLAQGKIVRAAKMQQQSAEVTLAGVVRHRGSRAAAQHVHMDVKAQSQPTTLTIPILQAGHSHTASDPQVCACSS